jgi:hypothetical protein
MHYKNYLKMQKLFFSKVNILKICFGIVNQLLKCILNI